MKYFGLAVFLLGLMFWAYFYYVQKQADGRGGAQDGDIGIIVLQLFGVIGMVVGAFLGLTWLLFGFLRHRGLLLLAFMLAANSMLAAPAHAGITFEQIAGAGHVPYVQLPDGTFLPVKGDANGNPGASPIPAGEITPVTVSSSAIGFTVPTGATWCLLAFETNAVRWRDDGTNPTASIGVPQVAGDKLIYSGALAAIKFIRQSADATLQGACYK